ncbi:MAG: restriction endonuclease subunit S [Gammaproteobacteria bacterium]|nr:restriction endonuclease subunit S [Gammaproteobacteria bacterium]
MRRRLRFDACVNPKKSSLNMRGDELVSFVPMDAVGEYGGLRLDNERELDDVYNGYTYFADGDICVAKITPCFENGKGALAEGLTNGVGFGTTELHIVRSGPTIDRHFLFYLSIADEFRKLGASEMCGAGGQKRIDESFIKNWMPPIAPLDIQRRIVQFLDEKTARIDRLIEKKRELLNRLAERRRALITHAVTKGINPDTPVRPSGTNSLGDIPTHWRVKRLRFMLNGGTLNGLYKTKDEYDAQGIPFVQMGEAFRSPIFNGGTDDGVVASSDEIEKWGLLRGDLLIARRSIVFEGSGKSVLVSDLEEPHLFESSMIRIRPKNPQDYSGYLSFFFQSHIGREAILSVTKRVTISGIDGQQLKSIHIPIPPNSEASNIAAYCETCDRNVQRIERKISDSIERLTEYRSALITAAVTGQIEELV